MTVQVNHTRQVRQVSQIVTCAEAKARLYLGANFAALGEIELPQIQDKQASNSTTNSSAAIELLQAAADIAQQQGLKTLIAPLDGDTWHSYRTIIESSDQSKFFLEPNSPISAADLVENGFELIAQYSSALIELRASQAAIATAVDQGQATIESSFTFRHLDLANFEGELRDIYALSLMSFENNFLYQAISFEKFAELYRPLSTLIEEKLVWLAFSQSTLIGMLFALPDKLNAGQIILKTVAVHPHYSRLGIASYLLARVHTEAIKLGFNRSVQALYKDENRSAALTANLSAKIIRRYGLFALDLSARVNNK